MLMNETNETTVHDNLERKLTMRCICPLSALTWKAEGFATGHHALLHPHPIFALPYKYLISRYSADWYTGKLSEEEKQLLFLSLLKSTELVIFDAPATPAAPTVEQNIESLVKLSSWIQALKNPAVLLPTFRITKESSDLGNVHFWLQAWWNAKEAFEAGYRQQAILRDKSRLEYFLDSKIKRIEAGLANETPAYLKILAAWADLAASFPRFAIEHPLTGDTVAINEYWKELIQAPESRWYSYPLIDWKELEDHIIDNIDDLSTTFAITIIRKCKQIINRTGKDMGLELVEQLVNPDTGERSYSVKSILEKDEQEMVAAIAATAPTSEPKQQDYPTKVAFLRAKIAWNFAKQQAATTAASQL